MNVYKEISVEGYQRVIEVINNDAGLHAIIAVHNTNLGPSLGGCRVLDYSSRDDMLKDALNLSKGMTYKSAMAGLNLGGGKAVINTKKLNNRILEYFAKALNHINRDNVIYITAGDMGINKFDLKIMKMYSQYVNGAQGQDSGYATAYGVYMGIMAALDARNIKPEDATVAIDGIGKVGRRLKQFLSGKFKQILCFDINPIERECIHISQLDNYLDQIDVYAPCSVGGTVNPNSIKNMKKGLIICGGANNQLSGSNIDDLIKDKEIVYVPDYVANCGGIIVVDNETLADLSYDNPKILPKLEKVYDTVKAILLTSDMSGKSTSEIANIRAEDIWKK